MDKAGARAQRIPNAIKKNVSFIGIHYAYIIGVGIIGSILVYPVKTVKYIDALFLSVAAVTQGGLNTYDLNKLTLYEQIILYLLAMITTPIFIHSSVVFVRLYWYEQHFRDIKQSSKIQSRMRRTATMARANSKSLGDYDLESSAAAGGAAFSTPSGKGIPGPPPDAGDDIDDKHNNVPEDEPTPGTKDIKFGHLPQPHRQNSIAPKDMYTSISMMQQRNRRQSADLGDGPALVIKGPREMDEEFELLENGGGGGGVASPSSHRRSESSMSIGSSSTGSESVQSEKSPRELQRSQSHTVDSSGSTQIEGIDISKRAHTIEGNPGMIGANPRTSLTDISSNHFGTSRRHGGHRRRSHHRGRKSSKGRRNRFIPRSLTFENALTSAKSFSRRDSSTERNGLHRTMSANYLSWQPTIGRNSQFVDLTPEQKEELGGVEYSALKLLAKILVAYYVGLHLLAAILLLPYINTHYAAYFREMGFSPGWWAFFTAQSGFNDVGFTLTPDSQLHFNQSAYFQIIMSFFMVVGNTGFPCLLRLIIWVMFKFSPKFGRTHESLAFLLDHPRRCFTMLFPASATWWLVAVLVLLNGVDLIFYNILDLNNPVVSDLAVGYRILNGMFQAFSTRTTGFSIVSLADLHAGVQVGYAVMMYISVLPLAISIRRTNVYEEQALGVYDSGNDDDGDKTHSYIANHLRRQLSFDMWYIAVGIFIITIAEGGKVNNDNKQSFDVFAIIFEVTSAYATCGMSLGYPGVNTSFSGVFTVVSKLVICAMLIRGRHRGLPYALDRAVMKPKNNSAMNSPDGDDGQLREANGAVIDSADVSGAATSSAAHNNNLRARSSIGSGFKKIRRMSFIGMAPGPPPPSSFKNQGRPPTITNTASIGRRTPGGPSSPVNVQSPARSGFYRIDSQAIVD